LLTSSVGGTARFRIKKKQREAELNQQAQELRDRVTELEKEVDTLKTENGWLRGLITDKAKVRLPLRLGCLELHVVTDF
jgi:cell division protein FtsB